MTLELPEQRRWQRGTPDQSNSVAFVGDRYVLKAFRRIEPTPNPEFEIGRFLSERGFTRTPPLVGALQYLRSGLEPGTLAVVQGLVKHQGSGWEHSIDELRRYYERIAPRVTGSEGPVVRQCRPRQHGPPGVLRRARTLVSRRRGDARTANRGTASDAGGGGRPGIRAGASGSRRSWRAQRRHARARRRVARPARSTARDAERGVAGARGRGAVAPQGAAVAIRRDPVARRRRPADSDSRGLSPGPGAPHRGGLRHPGLRGRAGAVDRRAPRQTVAAQGRRRDDPFVQLRGLRGAVSVYHARTPTTTRSSSRGPTHGSTGRPTPS